MVQQQIQPELELTYGERADLAAITPTAGFHIIHRIMRAEVDKFVVALINTDPGDREQVVATHLLAKAAAQFYAALTNRINEEVTLYTAAPRATDKPVDVTAALDLDGIADQFNLDDVPNLLEEMR